MVQTAGKSSIAEQIDDELFDDTIGYDDEPAVKTAGGLTLVERVQAATLYHLFNELWGVCIVVGDPGSGKDLFGNVIAYKVKRYFPWKRILRDEKPRALFGKYAGLFNEEVLVGDLAKMQEVAVGVSAVRKRDVLQQASDKWVTERGAVLLKDSLLYLVEYWHYCYRRDPMNPMNTTMGGIHKEKRHIDTLIIGSVQTIRDLDRFTCLPWVDWRVTCVRSRVNLTGFTYFVEKVKYDRRMDMLIPVGVPFPMSFDAGKPRNYIGDGKVILRKPDYRPETEEERVVLNVLRAGADDYDDIVHTLETDGDMTEDETLVTLKGLGLKLPNRRPKFVVSYPCFFKLYNSKSPPQLKTRLKVAE